MFKTIDLTVEVLRMRTVKANASHNRGNWKHLRIIQEIPVQHTRKARIQGTTENSHIVHCTCTLESTNAKSMQKFSMGNNITCSANCNYRISATLCTVETWFVSSM